MRAETRFTPKPWEAAQQLTKGGVSLGWIINHANGRIGWSSFATSVPNEGEGAPHPIGGANAHLIASAPEMYDALLDCEWSDGGLCPLCKCSSNHAGDCKLGNALRKARGE